MTVTYMARADDTWVMKDTHQGLEEMRRELAPEVRRHTGFVIRCEKRGFAQGVCTARVEPSDADTPMLSKMELCRGRLPNCSRERCTDRTRPHKGLLSIET